MIFLQVFFYGILSAAATVLADYLTFRVHCGTGDEPPAPLEQAEETTAEAWARREREKVDDATNLAAHILVEAKLHAYVKDLEQKFREKWEE